MPLFKKKQQAETAQPRARHDEGENAFASEPVRQGRPDERPRDATQRSRRNRQGSHLDRKARFLNRGHQIAGIRHVPAVPEDHDHAIPVGRRILQHGHDEAPVITYARRRRAEAIAHAGNLVLRRPERVGALLLWRVPQQQEHDERKAKTDASGNDVRRPPSQIGCQMSRNDAGYHPADRPAHGEHRQGNASTRMMEPGRGDFRKRGRIRPCGRNAYEPHKHATHRHVVDEQAEADHGGSAHETGSRNGQPRAYLVTQNSP